MVDNRRHIGYTSSCPVREGRYGGIAQLARALGSYPSCPRFKSRCRYHAAHAAPHGALVKRLRHRPFTAVTRVRFPYASPTSPIWRHSSAGRALASHARGHRFEFCCLHQKKPRSRKAPGLFSFLNLLQFSTGLSPVSGRLCHRCGASASPGASIGRSCWCSFPLPSQSRTR